MACRDFLLWIFIKESLNSVCEHISTSGGLPVLSRYISKVTLVEESVAKCDVVSACKQLNLTSQISAFKKSQCCTCRIILYFGSNGGPAGPVLGRSSMSSLHPTVKCLHLVHSCYILNSVSQECVCLGLELHINVIHTGVVEEGFYQECSLLSCF